MQHSESFACNFSLTLFEPFLTIKQRITKFEEINGLLPFSTNWCAILVCNNVLLCSILSIFVPDLIDYEDDARCLKSCDGNVVRVQVPSGVPAKSSLSEMEGFFVAFYFTRPLT